MTERDGWPERFDILPHPIKRLGRALLGCVQMHQLSERSDHFNTGGGPALDRGLYDKNPMRPIYAVHDDGATQGSLFDSLFYPEEKK